MVALGARAALTTIVLVAVACSRGAIGALSPSALPFPVDTLRTRTLGDGAVHHFIYSPRGPWAIHVLDVRLDRCLTPVAVKGGSSAIGRRTTSALLAGLDSTRDVVGGVNADFFLFAPPGVPTNAHVSAGRVITPPSRQPVFAMDSAGRPHIGVFAAQPADSFTVDDPRLARVRLTPFHPIEAVGGRPLLARDSVLGPTVDTEGQAGFADGRHPRTAVGIADRGRRLVLVVVDGRRPSYSAGMTLRELATTMLALGTPHALNLDGGGSSAMVVADPANGGALGVVNWPSDPTGERAVANALAIVRSCRDGR